MMRVLIAFFPPFRALALLSLLAGGSAWAQPSPGPSTGPKTYAVIGSPVSVTTTATALYAPGTPASVLVVANNGASGVYLSWIGTAGGYCTAATTSVYSFLLQPGQGYVFGTTQGMPTCAISALAVSGTNSVSVVGY